MSDSFINCGSDCIYQKDGNCTLDNIQNSFIHLNHDSCVHYKKRPPASGKSALLPDN